MSSEYRNEWVGIALIVLVGLILIGFAFSIYSVPAGSVGVVTRWGAVDRVVQPGVGLKVPFAERVRRMDVRTQKNEVASSAASSDLQTVNGVVSVNYHLDGKYATAVFQSVGKNYDSIVLDPAVQQAFKTTTAQYTAEEIITKRSEIAQGTLNTLQVAMEPYHLVIEAVNIVNVDFSEEYNNSIEQKQVQQQKVEIAELKRQEAQKNAETIVINAQAEADAQEILSQSGSLTPAYLQFLFLSNWDGQLPQVMVEGSGATPVFDVSSYIGDTQ